MMTMNSLSNPIMETGTFELSSGNATVNKRFTVIKVVSMSKVEDLTKDELDEYFLKEMEEGYTTFPKIRNIQSCYNRTFRKYNDNEVSNWYVQRYYVVSSRNRRTQFTCELYAGIDCVIRAYIKYEALMEAGAKKLGDIVRYVKMNTGVLSYFPKVSRRLNEVKDSYTFKHDSRSLSYLSSPDLDEFLKLLKGNSSHKSIASIINVMLGKYIDSFINMDLCFNKDVTDLGKEFKIPCLPASKGGGATLKVTEDNCSFVFKVHGWYMSQGIEVYVPQIITACVLAYILDLPCIEK